MPVSIVSNRDPRFPSKLWPSLQKALVTKLKFSSAFHPDTGGQSQRTIQGVLHFDRKGKLSPRYIGSYVIVERVGLVAYRVKLLLELTQIHNMFHVSMLRKYISYPYRVLEAQPVELREELSYEERASIKEQNHVTHEGPLETSRS
ncbi:uncharacterized protein E6C27_scaffold1343G00110 [Cucumis melo var. makuwa]|uniref:Tf2-1-like SH3-like domain-containing protein n=1 Tax=Cucumis melo var. makuwa TaxID=1194695 RepID=A0A5A7VE02_CUCMM|nr:uncharacterized protein E6C27_scaffold1343G00110 [Cucumis melo var. makuwa]